MRVILRGGTVQAFGSGPPAGQRRRAPPAITAVPPSCSVHPTISLSPSMTASHAMFKCSDCNKTYKTRTSLTRHSHNHAAAPSQHACDRCGVVFARRDILNRHINNGHCATDNRGRGRCHTACEGCRSARIKCDGQDPCKACVVGKKECKYPKTTGRVSWAMRNGRSETNNAGPEQAYSSSPSLSNGTTGTPKVPHGSTNSQVLHDESNCQTYTTESTTSTNGIIPAADVYQTSTISSEIPQQPSNGHSFGEPTQDQSIPNGFSRRGQGISQSHLLHNAHPQYVQIPSGQVKHEPAISGPTSAPQTIQFESGFEKPLEATPQVTHVPWPWLHEKNFMGSRSRGNASEKTYSPQRQVAEGDGSTPDSIGSPSELGSEYRDTLSPLANVIENLVAYAANTAFTPEDRSVRRRYWESVSLQLSDVFQASGSYTATGSYRTLYDFAEAYLTEFNIIWPILNHQQLDLDTQHPVLFLVVTSVGAMFGQPTQRQYGAMMHVRLRRLLCASLYDLEGPAEDEMIWLAQARLLAQISSLYFGQHQGFSYSQHLAAITIAQMRRMDFFREPIPDITRHMWRSEDAELARWDYDETRRRLAFGILRTDAYNSVLLSTRPLLTSEEVKLTFPRADMLWFNSDNLTPRDQIIARRKDDDRVLPMPLADLVRIFLDRQEVPPELEPIGLELVLFGLQEWVWRFSQDTELYVRLTGRCLDGTKIDFPDRKLPSRPMNELGSDFLRLTHALEVWSAGMGRAVQRGDFKKKRDTMMCCMLLYRLSKLRMCAPLEDLHHLSYRAADLPTIDANIFRKVLAWMRSPFAVEAATQAWDIKSLIENELKYPRAERVRFNFLSFCCLHHSAVVLWVVTGVNKANQSQNFNDVKFNIPNEDIETFIEHCAGMFSQLSPLGNGSFAAAARRLHVYRFPQYLPQYHEAVK